MSLKENLKEMIIRECDKDIEPSDIKDNDIIFDPNHPLGFSYIGRDTIVL